MGHSIFLGVKSSRSYLFFFNKTKTYLNFLNSILLFHIISSIGDEMKKNKKKTQLIIYYHGTSISKNELIDIFEKYCDNDTPYSSISPKDDIIIGTDNSQLIGKNGYFHYNISSRPNTQKTCQKVQKSLEEYGTHMLQNFLDQSIAVIVYDNNQKKAYAGISRTSGDVELYIGRVTEEEILISNELEIVELYCQEVALMPDYSFYMDGYIFFLSLDYSESIDDFLKINEKDILTQKNQQNPSKISSQKPKPLPAIETTYSKIKKYIIGQDDAIKEVLMALYNNRELSHKNLTRSEIVAAKENVLLVGPAGVGKTEIVRQLENVVNTPVIEVDIQQYSPTGYVGKDVMEILENIYIHSNGNLEVAEQSVLFIDEIDKKLFHNTEETFPLATINQLLKIIEGGRYCLANGLEIDSKSLIVVCAGAFQSLFTKDTNKNAIGFENYAQEKEIPLEKRLAKYGLPEEFLSRMKRIVQLNMLTKEDQKRYLLESKLSILNIKSKLFKEQGIEVHYRPSKDSFVSSLIDDFEQNGMKELGLRGLNSYVSTVFDEVAWDIYNKSQTKSIELSTDQMKQNRLSLQKK